MDEKTDLNDPAAADSDTGTPPAEAKNTEDLVIPKRRFDEVNEARIKAEAELKRIADDAEAKRIADERAQRDALAEQGKHKDALTAAEKELTELRPLKDRIATYEKAVGQMLTTRMAGIPEHIAKLLNGMEPLAALAWLDENADQLGRKPAPQTDADKRGADKGDDTFSKSHIDKVMEELGYPSR